MARRRRGGEDVLNPWPGYVDALSTLLMVIIFVLLVFVLAQAFLSVALTGRDRALDRLNRQVAELTDMLSLERGRAVELQQSVAQLNRDLLSATQARETLTRELSGLREEQSRILSDRDALRTERDTLSARLADAALQSQAALARNEQLQARVTETAGRTDQAGQEAATLAAQLADSRRQLAQLRLESDRTIAARTADLAQRTADLTQRSADLTQRTEQLTLSRTQMAAVQAELDRTVKADKATIDAQLADLARLTQQLALSRTQLAAVQADLDRTVKADKATIDAQVADLARLTQQLAQTRTQLAALQADLDRTVKADKATLDARMADLVRLNEQLRSLQALRDDLERQVRDAAVRATTEEQRRAAMAAQLAGEKEVGDSARARVALLSQQMDQLRAQLTQIAAALDIATKAGRDKDAQIVNLGSQLNVALASKVEELQRYRSEFFGRLREVLSNRQGIQVVGDRFVFQSEVLFPVGSVDMTGGGQDQIKQLANTLKDIAKDIPKDVNWILRVDGHADRQPLGRGQFASNWELSAQRAINVVKLLVDEGVPAQHLAATGFGEFQPLDGAETAQSYARNRRIELRLTDR